MTHRSQQWLGWAAVGISTLLACVWSFWGIIENFHEGWFGLTLWENLRLMLIQYLFVPFVFVAAASIGIRWPRIGGSLFLAAGLAMAWRFRGASWFVVYVNIVGPLVLVGVLYWFGRPRPRRWAASVAVGLPLVTMVIFGAEPVYRVAGRIDDGDRLARHIMENGVDLIWAPAGPGWPKSGVAWEEAKRRCRYLSADGDSLAETPQDVWRLPTVEEAVRSQARHGQNCGGSWDATSGVASYQRTPDKESPLWDSHSQVIYWWTATEVDDREAYIIVYDGKIWPRQKRANWGYLGFRAVKDGVARP
jgi:hypothetical protein